MKLTIEITTLGHKWHQAAITTDRKTVTMPPCATEAEALKQALRYCTLEQERGEWSSLFGTRS